MVWPGRFPRHGSPWFGAGLAVVLVLLATAISATIPALIFTPLAPYFVAVALSAWGGGTRAALIALLGSLLPIHFVALIPHPADAPAPAPAAYVVFILVSTLLVAVTRSRDRAVARAEYERARAAMLADATRGLGGVTLDLEATLEAIVGSAAGGLGDLAVLRLLSRDGAWLETVAWDHPDPQVAHRLRDVASGERHAANQGATGDALRTGHAIRLTAAEVAVRKRDNPALWPARPDAPSEVLLAAPLRLDGRAIGTLSVSRPTPRRPYTSEDERFLQELADRAALAIERARLFDRVRANEARLATMVEQLPVGIGLADADGQWLLTNAEMRQYVGSQLPSRDPSQHPEWQCFGEQNSLLPPEQWPGARALRGETVPGVECLVTRQGDEGLWTRVSAAPFADTVGQVAGVVCVIQDIDAQKRAEEERVAFLDALAHDIKNPLGAAKGQIQLAQRRIAPEDPAHQRLARNLEAAEQALERANSLLGEVLDMAHFRAGHLLELHYAPVDLVALATAALDDLQARSPEHRLLLESRLPALAGLWDGPRLDRVIRNLLENAVKFSPDGGDIRLSLDECRVEDGTGWATLRVQDPGVGIPADDLERIFERFQRGRNVGNIRGSGIGLTGVRQIVQQHGGTIAVESAEGRGATFTLRLPLLPEEPCASPDIT